MWRHKCVSAGRKWNGGNRIYSVQYESETYVNESPFHYIMHGQAGGKIDAPGAERVLNLFGDVFKN